MCRNRIIPTEIELVDAFGVVIIRAIITARSPFARQSGGRGKAFCQLHLRLAFVHQAYGLVVQKFIIIPVSGQEITHNRLAKSWPAMAGDKRV